MVDFCHFNALTGSSPTSLGCFTIQPALEHDLFVSVKLAGGLHNQRERLCCKMALSPREVGWPRIRWLIVWFSWWFCCLVTTRLCTGQKLVPKATKALGLKHLGIAWLSWLFFCLVCCFFAWFVGSLLVPTGCDTKEKQDGHSDWGLCCTAAATGAGIEAAAAEGPPALLRPKTPQPSGQIHIHKYTYMLRGLLPS